MSNQSRALQWSLGLHGFIVLLAAGVSDHFTAPNSPVVIDFSIEEAGRAAPQAIPHATMQPTAAAASVQANYEVVKRQETEQGLQRASSKLREIEEMRPIEAVAASVPVPLSSVKANSAPAASVLNHGSGTDVSVRTTGSTHPGNVNNGAEGKRSSDGSSGYAPEEMKQRYIKEQFAYIRERVVKNLFYPSAARKKGWEGKLTLSFCVAKDGSVTTIKILESSGKDVLDKCAIDAVKLSAPFPRPPLEAEVIIPIVYRLK